MAGVAGFEPTNAGVKVPCRTAWRHPIMATVAGFEPTMPESESGALPLGDTAL